MKGFHNLISRYKQFGGFRLVVEYAKLGVLGTLVKGFFRCLLKGQSFKAIYPEVLKKIEPMLVEKYGTQIPQIAQRIKANTDFPNNTNNKSSRIGEFENKPIWFCWLQGLDQAPTIVHACFNSIKRNIPDREIKIIDNENWKEYVELPGIYRKEVGEGKDTSRVVLRSAEVGAAA